jgi:glycosyltransferase involved in cell wall biosynthesis
VLAAPQAAAVHFVGPFISLGRLAVNAAEPSPMPPRLGRGCRFLYLGQLVPRKGIDVLLKAFAAAGIDGELLLVGGDWKAEPYGQELARLIEGLHLADRVTTCDHRTDVGNLLRDSDVLVLPSHSEAIPRTVLEAMVLGRPVLATRVGGIPSVVADGVTGLLVQAGDVDDLADAIRRLARDADLRDRLARSAQQWAARAIDPTDTAKRYKVAYQNTIDGQGRDR